MVCFSTQNTIGDWDFHRETFILRLSLTAHIHDIFLKIILFRHKIKEITRTFKDRRSSSINNRDEYKEHLLCINAILTSFIGMLISVT